MAAPFLRDHSECAWTTNPGGRDEFRAAMLLLLERNECRKGEGCGRPMEQPQPRWFSAYFLL
jgi:hypothetical protein